jgi:hypothetical protein
MFNLSKPVVLNLYTSDPAIFKYSKWENANNKKPAWWKNLLSTKGRYHGDVNMKHCSGFNDLYTKAISIPMWCDFRADIPAMGPGGLNFEFANPKACLDQHPESQRNGFLPEIEYTHMKLASPWLATCKEPVQFMMTNAFWDTSQPFEYYVPNGVLNFKHQSSANINMFVKKSLVPNELFIEQGTPIALLVPLTERKVVLKYNLVSQEELYKLKQEQDPPLWFSQRYYKAKKCPFSK